MPETATAWTAKRVSRSDIQALRAVAVVLVMLYHFWPRRLTGGYIGVDVFFVISGFLISKHLFENVPSREIDLAEFWGRRIRRLLPAAFLVIIVCLAAAVAWAPSTTWLDTAWQSVASALYVQNWALAAQSVDYLGQEDAPSAVQHYWSLSVEEQFYLVWPLLFFAVAAALRRSTAGRRRDVTFAVLLVVTAASFAYSVYETPRTTGAYYFSTVRAWELGLGGLCGYLAVRWPARFTRVPSWSRYGSVAVGLALIGVAAVTFDGGTPFPGWAAAIPVCGAALVILAVSDDAGGWLPRLTALRPVQYTGDISYSLYLWHWPLVALMPYVLGHAMSWPEKLLCVAATFVLAGGTKRYVEDRFRGRRPLGRPLRRSYTFAVAGALVVAVACTPIVWRTGTSSDAAALPAGGTGGCYGAAAMKDRGCDPHGAALLTSPDFAKDDIPWAGHTGCLSNGDFRKRPTCQFGSDDANALQVALVGNSHAAQYLPALLEIAKRRNWHITTFLMFECYSVTAPIEFPNNTARTPNCVKWNRATTRDIQSGRFDLVVTSNRTYRSLMGVAAKAQRAAQRAAYQKELTAWSKAGTPVLDIREPPVPPRVAVDCVAQHADALSRCDASRGEAQTSDPQAAAAVAMASPLVRVADLSGDFCRGESCYSVIGGVIAYFNNSHLTATFARTLAPDIERAAVALLSD